MASYLLPHERSDWLGVCAMLGNLERGGISYEEVVRMVWKNNENVRTLEKYIDLFHGGDKGWFLEKFLPLLATLAKKVENLFPLNPFCGEDLSISLDKLQIGCLLSHAFFGTLSRHPKAWSCLQFTRILQSSFYRHQIHKLACICEYFQCIFEEMENNTAELQSYVVTYERKRIVLNRNIFVESTKPLVDFVVHETGGLSDACDALLVDFANERIGGHVLTDGMVQEEIHFTVHPECFVVMLFSSPMKENEVIYIRGAQKYCKYSGYGSTFMFEGREFVQFPERIIKIGEEEKKQHCIDVVAMDAVPYSLIGRNQQWNIDFFHRELTKAYCAFNITDWKFDQCPKIVSTGNWGCGMFGGDKQMKAVLQWIAAAEAGIPIHFYTHNDSAQASRLNEFISGIPVRDLTVSVLYKAIVQRCQSPIMSESLFHFLGNYLSSYNKGTDYTQ